MQLTGQLLIGQSAVAGQNGTLHAIAAATGDTLEPAFGGASLQDLETACALADDAFDTYRETRPEQRAAFLDAIGRNIMALGDDLIERCVTETGLPRARVEGERGRTVGQLALFASLVRDGGYVDARIDLHGLRQDAAHHRLRTFLIRGQEEGYRLVLVITGKGSTASPTDLGRAERGVLRRSVPAWLDSAEFRGLVVGYDEAGPRHGGGGALYVRIRRRSPV